MYVFFILKVKILNFKLSYYKILLHIFTFINEQLYNVTNYYSLHYNKLSILKRSESRFRFNKSIQIIQIFDISVEVLVLG